MDQFLARKYFPSFSGDECSSSNPAISSERKMRAVYFEGKPDEDDDDAVDEYISLSSSA